MEPDSGKWIFAKPDTVEEREKNGFTIKNWMAFKIYLSGTSNFRYGGILKQVNKALNNMTRHLQLANLELILNRRFQWLQVKLNFTNNFFAPIT